MGIVVERIVRIVIPCGEQKRQPSRIYLTNSIYSHVPPNWFLYVKFTPSDVVMRDPSPPVIAAVALAAGWPVLVGWAPVEDPEPVAAAALLELLFFLITVKYTGRMTTRIMRISATSTASQNTGRLWIGARF